MIRSMTGFGRAESANNMIKFVVEAKSVNHRFLDTSVRIPKEYGFLETSVRAEVKKYLIRGKVDLYITYVNLGDADLNLQFNEHLAEEYVNAYRRMAETFGLENDLTVSTLGMQEEIFALEEKALDEEAVWGVLKEALDNALVMLAETRSREGEDLKRDLLEKLVRMKEIVDSIERRYPELLLEYRERLRDKVRELFTDNSIDENRIATEVVLYADKLATDEETVRLKSHIDSMIKEISEGGDVGRKLDFIAQEMNRESNTILSKATDLETTNLAIDLKTEIEKIREQVQNVE